MSWRLADKAIIITGTVLLMLMDSMGSIGGADVVFVLSSLIILFFTELRKEEYAAMIIAAALIPATLYIQEAFILIPPAVYALGSCDRKIPSPASYIIRGVLAVSLVLCGVMKAAEMYMTLLIIFFSLVALYLAVKSVRDYMTEEKIRQKYDDARLESLNARRLGEEIMKNADNEIYTATLKERNRIAREIHDNTGHMITRVIVQLQAIKIINKDEKVGEQLDSVAKTLDLAMTGIRKSVHELHDDSIDLSIGINDIARPLKEKFEVEVRTSIDSPADNKTKNVILGIIKEAVTNISKYSKGDKVLIEVVENVTFWRIKVFDNGKNEEKEYDTSDVSSGDEGIGIKNIGSRAQSLGGRANVTSNADGFTVLVTIPKEEKR